MKFQKRPSGKLLRRANDSLSQGCCCCCSPVGRGPVAVTCSGQTCFSRSLRLSISGVGGIGECVPLGSRVYAKLVAFPQPYEIILRHVPGLNIWQHTTTDPSALLERYTDSCSNTPQAYNRNNVDATISGGKLEFRIGLSTVFRSSANVAGNPLIDCDGVTTQNNDRQGIPMPNPYILGIGGSVAISANESEYVFPNDCISCPGRYEFHFGNGTYIAVQQDPSDPCSACHWEDHAQQNGSLRLDIPHNRWIAQFGYSGDWQSDYVYGECPPTDASKWRLTDYVNQFGLNYPTLSSIVAKGSSVPVICDEPSLASAYLVSPGSCCGQQSCGDGLILRTAETSGTWSSSCPSGWNGGRWSVQCYAQNQYWYAQFDSPSGLARYTKYGGASPAGDYEATNALGTCASRPSTITIS